MSATSTDGGATWNRDHLVYASPEGAICPCCHPSLAVRGDRVLAMFRNDLAGARDMYVAESGDGGRTWRPAVKLGDRTWPLEMCPMDGGALALDREGVLTAWRRGESVFLARPGKPERELGRGANPVLAVTPNGPVVAWNGPGGLYIARGNTPPAVVAPGGAFAAAVPTPRGVVLAYERGGQSLVRVLTP